MGENALFTDLMAAIGFAAAGATLARAALIPRAERVPWLLVAVGLACFALGNLWRLLLTPAASEYPSAGDLLLFAFYGFAFAGVWLLIRRSWGPGQLTLWLDAGMVAAALSAVSLQVVATMLPPGGETDARIVTGVATIMLDQLLLGVALVATLVNRYRLDSAYPLIALGAGILAVTDVIHLRQVAAGAYAVGTALDFGWTAAIVLLGLACWRRVSVPRGRTREHRAFYLTTGASLAVAMGVMVWEYTESPDVLVLVMAAVVPVMVFARLLLMLWENGRLVRDREDMVEAIGEGVLRADADGVITFANPAALRMTGWRREELVGMPGHDTLHHSHPDGSPYPAQDCPIAQELAHGETRRITDQSFWRRDGSRFPITCTVAPIRENGVVTGSVVVFDDVTTEHEAQARLRHQADHDSLTGLYNRRRFNRELERRLRDGRGTLRTGSVILLDLDHFQFVNDSLGHIAGDRLLVTLAATLRKRLSEDDVIARLGADEFAVLLPDCDEEDAMAVANDLVRTATRLPDQPSVGLSAGVAFFHGSAEEGDGPDELMIAADVALFEAKERGGGAAVRYTGARGRNLTWVDAIRQALAEDRLVLYAQPIVNLRTGGIDREELLIRMLDERGELVPPSAFLPTAERFGLMRELDGVVLAKAIALCHRGRRVAVNVSGRSVAEHELIAQVEDAVAAGLDPGRLCFELTETAAVADLAAARKFARRLRELGCGLALDDFGTGFGSLTYLKHVPVDCLKIDVEFVRRMSADPADRRLVETVVEVARLHRCSTVAEGVEDARTLELLQAIGVDCAQGFHLGPPVPAEAEPKEAGCLIGA